MQEPKIKNFLSIDEFAEYICVHPNTVRNMIRKGKLSAFRLSGDKGWFRIPRTEVERLSMINLGKIVDAEVEKRIIERQGKK